MNKISVVINTLNEEGNIKRAIKSVKKFADEIVVVDMESNDNTRKIAKQEGAKVFKHRRMGYVEPARNFAIAKTKGDWVFILDADEEVSQSLAVKIVNSVKSGEKDYFTIPRKNMIFGKWMEHTGWWPDYNIRLFKKGKVHWEDEIHSVPITMGNGSDFPPEEDNAIIHHNYKSVDQYIERLNKYTSIQAKEIWGDKKSFNWQDVVKKPTSEFVTRFFKLEGYKDGLHGLALSLLQAFSELVVQLKVWQESKFIEEQIEFSDAAKLLSESQSEINYWKADVKIQQGAGFLEKIKRKLKLL